MGLQVSDKVVARVDITGLFRGSVVPRGTPGVVLSRHGGDVAAYRVNFSIPGFPVHTVVLGDLTDYDIQKAEPVRSPTGRAQP